MRGTAASIPQHYYADVNEQGDKYVVLMEDLGLRIPSVAPGDEVRVSMLC